MTDPVHDPNPQDRRARDPNARDRAASDTSPRDPNAERRGPARAAATIAPESAADRTASAAATPEERGYEAERMAMDQAALEQRAGRSGSAESGSVAHLLRQLVDDVATLVRKELALASSEISHSVSELKQGLVSMVTGGAILYLGLVFLLLSATIGLAQVMPGWAAALIVGGVVTLIGVIMLMVGKQKVEPSHLAPNRTADSLRKDRDMVERQTR